MFEVEHIAPKFNSSQWESIATSAIQLRFNSLTKHNQIQMPQIENHQAKSLQTSCHRVFYCAKFKRIIFTICAAIFIKYRRSNVNKLSAMQIQQ